MTVQLEITRAEDLAMLSQLAKRLGWKHSTNESTEYLMSSKKNKKHLLEQIEYIESGAETIKFKNNEELKKALLG